MTNKLCARLNKYNEESFTLEDIKRMQEVLDIQTKIVCAKNFNSIVNEGREKETKIYLYKQEDHFNTISSMKTFYGSVYFYEKYNISYNKKHLKILLLRYYFSILNFFIFFSF